LLLAAGLGVQARLVDRGTRRRGERDHQRLVIFVERVAAALVGQVEVAVDRVVDLHRRAEERPHRRMPGREARRHRVSRDIGRPKRPRVGDQLAEQPSPSGQ
jgi:hypothetical protein